jgi:predicted lipoprotein with Yx(FWY)xxD motif
LNPPAPSVRMTLRTPALTDHREVPMKRTSLAGALALLGALTLALAACGGQQEPSSPDAGSQAPAAAASVTTAESDLGVTLADADGRTLYAFTKDKGGQSACYDDCAATWPALTIAGDPAAGDGIDGSLLATASRKDGAEQVTYKGMPLYYFSGDQKPGETNGQGVGGVWFTVTPTGQLVGAAAEQTESGSGDQGGSGYGYP